MTLVQRLEGRQNQASMMTAQMQASVRLLQLANDELQSALDTYVQENPLLELQEAVLERPEPTVSEENSGTEQELSLWERATAPAKGASANIPRTERSLEWIPEEAGSLEAHLQRQICQTFLDVEDRFLAVQMSHLLTEWGYFKACIKELARKWLVPISQLERILAVLKGIEPVGIFSQSLEECLAVQLKDLGIYGALHKMLLPSLQDLFGKNSHKVRQKLGVEEETIRQFVADIRRCYPKPAQGWLADDKGILKSPDVIVFQTASGAMRLKLNEENLPRLLINNTYVSDLTEMMNATPDKNATKYFKEKMSEANWLRRSVHQRAETILSVTTEILKHQNNFFEMGIKGLKPLCLKDIANILKIHESTVSRAISGKTVETPRGIIALKAFFTTGLTNYEQELTSAVAIQQCIKDIVSAETPDAPYSDAQLIDLLAGKGIRLARRTVAKYREILKIPTSYNRKHAKNRGF